MKRKVDATILCLTKSRYRGPSIEDIGNNIGKQYYNPHTPKSPSGDWKRTRGKRTGVRLEIIKGRKDLNPEFGEGTLPE